MKEELDYINIIRMAWEEFDDRHESKESLMPASMYPPIMSTRFLSRPRAGICKAHGLWEI